MSGIFSKPKMPTPTPPPAPSAPVEEATFKPGGEEKKDTAIKAKKQGKKRLQIPTNTGISGTGVGGI